MDVLLALTASKTDLGMGRRWVIYEVLGMCKEVWRWSSWTPRPLLSVAGEVRHRGDKGSQAAFDRTNDDVCLRGRTLVTGVHSIFILHKTLHILFQMAALREIREVSTWAVFPISSLQLHDLCHPCDQQAVGPACPRAPRCVPSVLRAALCPHVLLPVSLSSPPSV